MKTQCTPITQYKGASHSLRRPQSATATMKQDPPPLPSKITMMSAGSSESLHSSPRPKTAVIRGPITRPSRSGISPVPPRLGSVAPSLGKKSAKKRHLEGHPLTLYGASYFYAWPDDVKRLGSQPKERAFDRKNNIIYHKHEGVVPKYLGYVPGYKFRHGATYGVLTAN